MTTSSCSTVATVAPGKEVPVLPARIPVRAIEHIGQGGNGSVYRGAMITDQGEEEVAVKTIPRTSFASKVKFQTFQNAMKRLLDCEHPNILRIESIFDAGDSLALVSELCSGADVVKTIQNSPPGAVPAELCRKIFRDLLEGLAHLHAEKVVHCDVKLDNIKFRAKESMKSEAVILDLDSCLIEDDIERTKLENSRIARGTFQYMPPEAFKGNYSYAGDIWSAGVTLFCLVDGHFPFKIKPNFNVHDLILAVSTPPRFTQSVWARIPGASESVKAMLQVNPALRPSAKELLEKHAWVTADGPAGDFCPSRHAASASTNKLMFPSGPYAPVRHFRGSASTRNSQNLSTGYPGFPGVQTRKSTGKFMESPRRGASTASSGAGPVGSAVHSARQAMPFSMMNSPVHAHVVPSVECAPLPVPPTYRTSSPSPNRGRSPRASLGGLFTRSRPTEQPRDKVSRPPLPSPPRRPAKQCINTLATEEAPPSPSRGPRRSLGANFMKSPKGFLCSPSRPEKPSSPKSPRRSFGGNFMKSPKGLWSPSRSKGSRKSVGAVPLDLDG